MLGKLTMDLCSSDFTGFFRSVHGHDPFPWQQALVTQLGETNEWPDVLDLPTGSGKTATLDAAVFHLALRYETPREAALRIALVVDRRLVVDDAHLRAQRLERALSHPDLIAESERPIIAEVSRRLRHLAGDGEPPLVAQRLRGGTPLEHDWARTPTQPTILSSTVDQVGSRLLFRGYGVSHRMKPVHAGLLGTDTLVLLDEAHLSEPFRKTLISVQRIGNASIKMVWLTATPSMSAERPFTLADADREHSVLSKRLHARKPAKLSIVKGQPEEYFSTVAHALVKQLQADNVAAPAIGVVVNRIDLARRIYENLCGTEACEAILLIGPSRAVVRNQIEEGLCHIRTGASRDLGVPSATEAHSGNQPDLKTLRVLPSQSLGRPLLIVATQCIEVGVDIDLDGLVTQAASIDALRQRFGRLNRAGRLVQAPGEVVALAEEITRRANDLVYGDRLFKTWNALQRMACDGEVDFGITAFEARLQECSIDVDELIAPKALAPVLMPAYLDLWSQTAPPPDPDPDIGLFLHGAERASIGVSLVWRSDITAADLTTNATDLRTLFSLVPPRAEEMLNVPLRAARAWLHGPSDSTAAICISDAPQRDQLEEPDATLGARELLAIRWAGADDPRTGRVTAAGLQPGDVLVIPAEYGGCDEFGWAPASRDPVADTADIAARPFRHRRHSVRIARDVASDAGQWRRLVRVLEDDGARGLSLVDRLLDALPAETTPDREILHCRPIREPLEAMRHARGNITVHFPYPSRTPETGAVLVAAHGLRDGDVPEASNLPMPSDAAPATEDEALSQMAFRPVSVDDHTHHVVKRVVRSAHTLDLPEPVAQDLALAAFLHDAGKADLRFQTYLAGGNSWNLPDGPAIAKSSRRPPPGAWSCAGLPPGWRHEALSVQMAQQHPRFVEAHDPALVLWLVGTHHGFGRPFFDFVDHCNSNVEQGRNGYAPCLGVSHWRNLASPGPESLAFGVNGADWPALYERLRRQYGVWGLAHLESLLRLADHRASE